MKTTQKTLNTDICVTSLSFSIFALYIKKLDGFRNRMCDTGNYIHFQPLHRQTFINS